MGTAKLLGRRIKALRSERGLTQEQLGERSRVNYKYIGAVERGEENPTLKILVKLARGLDIEIDQLLQFRHEETDKRKLREEIQRLLKEQEAEKLRLALKILRAIFH